MWESEVGFRLRMPKKIQEAEVLDVLIIGAGPAGLAAALYSKRFGLKTACVGEDVGGTLNEAGIVDDYIGIQDIFGPELAKKFVEHVKKYEVPIYRDAVVDVMKEGNVFRVSTRSGTTFITKAVILAVGSKRRRLGVPGEAEFAGKGVTYCAACDAPLFKEKVVAVVGGGNSALQSALLMTSYASKVYLIHRRSSFRAYDVYIKSVTNHPKIELVLNSVIKSIGGSKSVEWVEVENLVTHETKKIRVDGVLIEIGSEPPKEFLAKIGLKLDEYGYVVVEPGQKTSIEGIFAAGDCAGGPHKKKFDQVVTAVAEGALAALSAYEYITRLGLEESRQGY
ncbi:MAG: NAD(P)/FAD-dependent oxidoreductase [Thermoprotei archaeon]